MSTRRIIAINERGLRIGEDHQHAKLTDEQCERIRDLHDEGVSYKDIANQFNVGKSTIAGICQFRRRNQLPMGYRTIMTFNDKSD